MTRAEQRSIRWINGLNRTVSVARRLDGRINNLHLRAGLSGPASVVEWQDHPDTQVLLMRRDRWLALQEEVEAASRALTDAEADLSPKERIRAMVVLAGLREQEHKELDAMSKKLDTLRGESTKKWATVGKLLTDLAKLRQSDKHFDRRLQMDEDRNSGLSSEERAIVNAVPVEAEKDGQI